ncbi:unnamed protein product [Pleuronectes platessa]|uniref:Uncharacterized protein n=1 Tax=Pleuronectes platessa TaxID=8262 RepID=A0A9N7W1W1_PLEPL|nr:unnamed protein product [Pleuronectes platessa]
MGRKGGGALFTALLPPVRPGEPPLPLVILARCLAGNQPSGPLQDTPVTHLYFGRPVSKEMLGRIGLNCPRLVELVVCATGLGPLDEELIHIAERCRSLTAVGLAECAVT